MEKKKWFDPQPAEWPVLAAVRFFMAVTVVVYHLPIVVRTPSRVPLLSESGGLGCICGFLAISGYSIAHSISTRPKGFFARRAWRIVPVYYVTMALALLPYLFVRKGTPSFRVGFDDFTSSEVVGSLFFLQCFITDKIPVFGPSWTLAIEWWFYMLAPLFIRLPKWALVFLVLASTVFQKEALDRGCIPLHVYKWGIPAAMLLWAWLSGLLYYRDKNWSALLLVIVGNYAISRFSFDGSPAAYLVASFAVVVARTLPPMPRILAVFLNYLGDLSYPVYLVHVPLLAWTSRWTDWYDPYAYIGMSLAAAALLYHFVDVPLRSRFSSRRPEGMQPDTRPVQSLNLVGRS